MISEAIRRVGRHGVITIEKGNSTQNNLEIVEGMQFDRGYLSKYFTDRRTMKAEFQDCKVRFLDLLIPLPYSEKEVCLTFEVTFDYVDVYKSKCYV